MRIDKGPVGGGGTNESWKEEVEKNVWDLSIWQTEIGGTWLTVWRFDRLCCSQQSVVE